MHIIETQKATYNVSIQFGTTLTIQGTASASIKKSELSLGFDLMMNINLVTPVLSDDEDGEILDETAVTINIPFKGSWKYKTIKSVNFTPPADAIDLAEMLGGLLGGDML